MLSINGHKTGVQKDNVSKINKRKVHISLLHPSKTKETPPIKKKSYANSPPKYMTTLIILNQNYSPFLSRMTKGKSLRGHHLLITRRASILILILIIIITSTIYTFLDPLKHKLFNLVIQPSDYLDKLFRSRLTQLNYIM